MTWAFLGSMIRAGDMGRLMEIIWLPKWPGVVFRLMKLLRGSDYCADRPGGGLPNYDGDGGILLNAFLLFPIPTVF
jgi:hypothetical protein